MTYHEALQCAGCGRQESHLMHLELLFTGLSSRQIYTAWPHIYICLLRPNVIICPNWLKTVSCECLTTALSCDLYFRAAEAKLVFSSGALSLFPPLYPFVILMTCHAAQWEERCGGGCGIASAGRCQERLEQVDGKKAHLCHLCEGTPDQLKPLCPPPTVSPDTALGSGKD